MRELETDWWFLSLPEDWQVDQDDDSIVITDPDEVGVITLTSLITDGERDIEAGLKDLMTSLGVESNQVESTMLGDFDGFYQEFQDGDDWVREWYLGSEHCLLLVSYDCDPDNKMMDRELVDDILDTLSLKAQE